MRNYLRRFRSYFSTDGGGATTSAEDEEEEDDEVDGEDNEAEERSPDDQQRETDAMLSPSPRAHSRRGGEPDPELGGGSSPTTDNDRARRSTTNRRNRNTSSTSVQPPPVIRKKLKRSETDRPHTTTTTTAAASSGSGSRSGSSKHQQQQKNKKKISQPSKQFLTFGPESSEEDSTTARLSRRSSVLVDLIALFRRSSSYGVKNSGRFPPQRFHDADDEEEEEPEEMSKEKVLEAIRQKKEIIGKVRLQPWNMRRKRRTLKVAQRHLQRQEARVSRWHLHKEEFQRRSKQFWRWLKNTSIYMLPWESKIKRIESHFGSVVSSYFIFLRWVLGVNITMSFIVMFFVVIPEWLSDHSRRGRLAFSPMKVMPAKVREHADELTTVLDFGGYLQYSYMFYGYYSSETYVGTLIQYHVPIAYFCVNLFLLAFCLFVILKKMTSNTRKSKLSGGKQEQYIFTWKVMASAWDYNIGSTETSASLYKANVIKLREATAEYNKKIKQKLTWLKFFTRLLVNLVIMSMMCLSVFAIYKVAQITDKDTFIKQNAVSITVALITLLFPPIFELILKLEGYRPRTALRTHLFRVLFFYLINYFTLVYSLFIMLNNLEAEMRANELNNLIQQQQMDGSFNHHHPMMMHHSYGSGGTTAVNSPYNRSYYEMVRRQRRGVLRKKGKGRGRARFKARQTAEEAGGESASFFYSDIPTTTAPAPRVWTTVFPNYGPSGVGVYNPKAIVLPEKKGGKKVHTTIFESHPIGSEADWSEPTTEIPLVLNYTTTPRIRYSQSPYRASKYDDLCWETLIGQEIAKIVTTDLVLTIFAILVIDFFRGLWVRYCTVWWCWSLETTFPEYGEFKVAENVLHLINNQGLIWLGAILVPMLPVLNNVKLIALMYIRAWACMTCNVPAKQIFRASRSSNFYLWLLLMMLCMSTLPVGFVIASKRPSKNCGPFAGQERFYSVIGEMLQRNLNKNLVDIIQYIMSPGIVLPLLMLML